MLVRRQESRRRMVSALGGRVAVDLMRHGEWVRMAFGKARSGARDFVEFHLRDPGLEFDIV
jgi:hypothetical protein